jgi:hypothetical protein
VNPDTREFLGRVKNPCLPKPFEVRETIGQVLTGGT